MIGRAKIAAYWLAKVALYPIASVAWTIVVVHEDIARAQQRLEREAGLDREWNAWRDGQDRGCR